MDEITIVVIVVGLVAFFMYLILVKKKKPKEALEEVVDYATEHKEELMLLAKSDLLEMEPEELEDMCKKLGLPISSVDMEMVTSILEKVKSLG